MYEKTVSDISKSLRAMAKRVRRAEAQLSRRRGISFGTSLEREANEQSQLWWDIDLDALMANFGNGWEPVKDVRTGTTAQRTAYTGINTGEFWWDTDEERLYAWDGSSWESTDSAESGTTVERNASSPAHGQWWVDTDDAGLVYVYDGIEWKAPASPRHVEPYLLLAGLYGLFVFRQINYGDPPKLQNLTDGVVGGAEYQVTQYNSPEFGDNGYIPYIDFTSSSSQYCTTKNYRTTGDLTVLAWVSPDTELNHKSIVDKWYWDIGNRCYRLALWSDNTFRFYVSDDGTNVYHADTGVLPSNELFGWNFVVGRFKAGNALEIYHNGAWTSMVGAPPASIHDYDHDIAFGKTNTPGVGDFYFDGQMSVVAICKHAISNELIDYIYESTKSSYIPQPEPQPSDNISVAEHTSVSVMAISAYVNASDNITTTENIDTYYPQVGTYGLSVSDSILVTENIKTPLPPLDMNVIDSIDVSESITADGGVNITTSDSISVDENIDVSETLPSSNLKINYLLTDDEYFCANYWSRIYPYWTSAWFELVSVSVSDNVAVADSTNIVSIVVAASVSDSITVEDIAHYYDSSIIVTEKISVTIYTLTPESNITGVSDSITVDDIAHYYDNSIIVTEKISVTIYTSTPESNITGVSDSITVDDIAHYYDSSIIVTEKISVTIYPLTPGVNITGVSDSVSTISENVDVYCPELDVLGISVSDGVIVSESVDVEHIPNPSTSDSITVDESTSAVVPDVDAVEASTSDSIITSENVDVALYLPPSYLMTDNGYFNANYWLRTYRYWGIAP